MGIQIPKNVNDMATHKNSDLLLHIEFIESSARSQPAAKSKTTQIWLL